MNISFKIKKGLQANLPPSLEEGVVYVCTDTGNVYADLNEERVKLTHLEKTQEGGYISEGASEAQENAFAIGQSCSAAAKSIALGNNNTVYIENSVAIGVDNTIDELSDTKKIGCIALGQENVVAGKANTAIGLGLISNRESNGGFVIGKFNEDVGKQLLVVGAGTSKTQRTSILTLDGGGNLVVNGAMKPNGGQDYAEYLEWLDGNLNNEIRTGRFVTLVEDKIALAQAGDDVIGIISATPCILGNASELRWNNRYLKDEFGATIYEEFINEDNELDTRPVENPNYDPAMKYIPRSQRPEWAPVGFMGQIIMLHDGTCTVGGYCAPGVDGIATSSSEKTNCRVMKVIDETHILVLLK